MGRFFPDCRVAAKTVSPSPSGQAKVKDRRVTADQLERGAGIGGRGGNIDGKTDIAEFRLQDAGKAVFILDDQKTQR
jgi:hypothetical protein